ncbi:hypothetical protein EFZ10_03550 [Tatumella sp. TA1]|nr:hypothetical protein EFZ10_03550 [Tatumella sp. TA1]
MQALSVVQLKVLSILFLITTIIFAGLFGNIYMESKAIFEQNKVLASEVSRLNLKVNELESLNKKTPQVKIIPRKGMTAEELRKQAFK